MAQLCFSAETDPFSRSMMTYGLAASALWCLPHISDQSQTDAHCDLVVAEARHE
jgi:hypothetical protein